MSYLPYRPEHVNDASATTEELTNEELGAFVRLQRALWRAGGYLPDDQKKLARYARAGSRWGIIAPAVMGKLSAVGGKVSCPEILMTIFLVEQRRAKAAKAAAVRHGKADHVLNGSNSLESFGANITGAESKVVLGASNQNQNKNLDSKTLSASGGAAGRRGNETFYELSAEFLIQRVGVRGLAARSQIAKWLAAMDGNETELGTIIHGVAAENLTGPHFVAVIDQQIAARNREIKKGLSLPFPPGIVINGGK